MTETVETRIREETYSLGMQKYKDRPAQIFACANGRVRNNANRVSAGGRSDATGETDVAAETDVTGENTERLEQAMAAYIGVRSAAAVSSGRMALWLALRLASERIGEGSPEETGEAAAGRILSGRRVFCPDFASQVYASMILAYGGMPVFIDASSDDWGMDPEALAAAFERYPEVKLVIASHVYGFPGRIDAIKEICWAHGALLIEDASEALGARYGNRMCGSFGDYGILDFESTGMKGEDARTNEGAAGGTAGNAGMESGTAGNVKMELVADVNVGGMLLINGKDREKAGSVSGQGSVQYPGYEMTDVTAGEIRGLFQKIEEQIAGRIAAKKKIYERYVDRLAELDVWMNPYDEENTEPNYQTPCMMISENSLSPVRWNLRDGRWIYEYDDMHGRTCPPELSDVLGSFGVKCRLVWRPLHLLPLYQGFDFVTAEEELWDGETGRGKGSVAETETPGEGEYLFERCLCLPSDVGMTEEEQERVVEMIRSCFDSCTKVDEVRVRY